MTTTAVKGYIHVIQDIAIIEMFNPDDKIWEYYVRRKGIADLEFVFGTDEQFDRDALRELWKKGYFEEI